MFCKNHTLALLTLALFATSPVLANTRIPYVNAESLQKLEPDESRMWYESQDFEKAIRKGGQIYPSPELDAYLQSIMDKLYPEFVGHIKVHVIKSPVLNAFAIPNGNIYINMGLLSRFDNEAQLATVLAHEGAHFVYRHGYYNQQSLKGSAGFATITAVLGVPIVGLIGNVIAVSSIFGYSRELETEADNMGFKRLVNAGYNPKEASKVFEHLAAEVKLSDIKESVFYSTHPKLQDRVENFTKLAALQTNDGVNNAEQYAANIDRLRLENLETELSFGRYKYIVAHLSNEIVLKRYPAEAYYYLAEAYRKRNDKGDNELAMSTIEKAIQLCPNFAPNYKEKGLLLMADEKNKEALVEFKRYLELAHDAKDKSYIQNYIETLQTNTPQN